MLFMDSMSISYLTEMRRKLHSLAELSGKEYNTSAFIIAELKRLGYKPKTIGTGVYCDVGGRGARLAFRADIDALPMTENTDVTGMREYAAKGAMHACGHDGHTANLLNVLRLLGGRSDIPLRFIFQFGEEGLGGSQTMIDGGVLDGVDEIYALHLSPQLPLGKVGYCYGAMFAGACEFDTVFTGKACHCAKPEKGANALHAQLDTADAAMRSAARQGLLLNLGKVTGGCARNIIAAESRFEYSLRFYDLAKCEAVMMETERAANAADDKFGTEHETVTQSLYLPLVNDALAVDKVRAVMGEAAVEVEPALTAEDFSYYLQNVRGCMVWLGIAEPGHESPLHSDTFSFDERALETGTELFMRIIGARSV